MNAQTNPTAEQACAAHRLDIARLIDVLQMELEARAEPSNWCIAGSLAKVRSDLIEIVGFTSGIDREEIERFLAE